MTSASVTIDVSIKDEARLLSLAQIADMEAYGEVAESYTPAQMLARAINNASLVGQAFECLDEWVCEPDEGAHKQGERNMSEGHETTVIVNVADDGITNVTGLPPGYRVIVRDWDRGNVPDENGDLYEETELPRGEDDAGTVEVEKPELDGYGGFQR